MMSVILHLCAGYGAAEAMLVEWGEVATLFVCKKIQPGNTRKYDAIYLQLYNLSTPSLPSCDFIHWPAFSISAH